MIHTNSNPKGLVKVNPIVRRDFFTLEWVVIPDEKLARWMLAKLTIFNILLSSFFEIQ